MTRGVKSFADDLAARKGPVSSRVALLLRSAEGQPFFASISHIFTYGLIRGFHFRLCYIIREILNSGLYNPLRAPADYHQKLLLAISNIAGHQRLLLAISSAAGHQWYC